MTEQSLDPAARPFQFTLHDLFVLTTWFALVLAVLAPRAKETGSRMVLAAAMSGQLGGILTGIATILWFRRSMRRRCSQLVAELAFHPQRGQYACTRSSLWQLGVCVAVMGFVPLMFLDAKLLLAELPLAFSSSAMSSSALVLGYCILKRPYACLYRDGVIFLQLSLVRWETIRGWSRIPPDGEAADRTWLVLLWLGWPKKDFCLIVPQNERDLVFDLLNAVLPGKEQPDPDAAGAA